MDVVVLGRCSAALACARALVHAGHRPHLVTGPRATETGDPFESEATRLGLDLERCDDAGHPEVVRSLTARRARLLVVAGWPRRLPPVIESICELGAVNVHPSLLPMFRAREPIFWTILSGAAKTGVTIHRLTDVLDAGPVLLQRSIEVGARPTSASLGARLDALSAEGVLEVVAVADRGQMPAAVEQNGEPTRFPPLGPDHGAVRWDRPAEAIDRLIRACWGATRAYASLAGMRLVPMEAEARAARRAAAPGRVLGCDGDALVIAASPGEIAIHRWLLLERVCTGAELAAELGLVPGTIVGPGDPSRSAGLPFEPP